MSKTHVPLDQVDDNPHQVRIDTGDLDNLAQSILTHGLRQLPEARLVINGDPVSNLTPHTKVQEKKWFLKPDDRLRGQLATGHRRVAAIQLLNDDDTVSEAQLRGAGLVPGHVPVDLQHLSDAEMLDIGTAENLDREELSPIEEARLIQEHVDAGRKLDAIAPHFGNKSVSWVSNRKRLLKLPTYVQEHVHEGEISVRQAQALVRHEEVEEEAKEVLSDFNALNSDLHAGNLVTGAVEGGFTSEDIRERTATLESVIEDAKTAKGPASMPCAFCGAEVGEPCTTRDGDETDTHRSREKALAADEAGVLDYDRVSADHLRSLIEPPSTKVGYSGEMYSLGDLVAAHQILRGYDTPTARNGHKARARKIRVEMERRVDVDGDVSLDAEEVVFSAPKWLRDRLDGLRATGLNHAIRQAADIHTDPSVQTDDSDRDREQDSEASTHDAGARASADLHSGGGGSGEETAPASESVSGGAEEGRGTEESQEPSRPSSRVVLVTCSKSKLNTPAHAQELYKGQLFQKSKAYAKQLVEQGEADAWFILSAKHGVVEPRTMLDPYDQTLSDASGAEKIDWARSAIADLLGDVVPSHDDVVPPLSLTVLGGKDYYEPLQRFVAANDSDVVSHIEIDTPFQGLAGNGEMMSWLDERTEEDVYTEPSPAVLQEQPGNDGAPVVEMPTTLDGLQQFAGQWGNEVFGRADADAIIAHLEEELEELKSDHSMEEAADCLLLLLGFSFDQEESLLEAARRKMETNVERTWGELDENGVVHHVEESPVGHVDREEVSALLSCSEPDAMWDQEAAAEASIASLSAAHTVAESRMETWRVDAILEELERRGEVPDPEYFAGDVMEEIREEVQRRLEPEAV